jgi:hypothetical protein
MRRVLCAATLAACLMTAAHSEEPAFAQRPETQPPSIGALSDMMISILHRHAILWMAGVSNNWPLADYEARQLKTRFVEAAQVYRNIPVETVSAATKALDDLSAAITAKNKAQFTPRFLDLTRSCNACHVSAGVGFVVIETPRTSPFTNQAFAPATK